MRYLILLAAIGSTSLSAAELQLKDQVYRGPAPAKVADLFVVDGKDAEAVAELPLQWQQPLGWNQVEQMLGPEAKPYGIVFKGEKRVWLSLCRPVALDAMALDVKSRLQQSYDKQRVEVDSVEPLSREVPCIALGSEPKRLMVNAGSRLAGRLSTQHRLADGKTMQLWWRVKYRAYGPVATENVAAGEPLTSNQVRFAWHEAANLTKDELIGVGQLSRLRSKRPIVAGQLVTRQNSEHIPDVEKGEKVKLILVNRGITIESAAKALQSGDVDDVIKVLVDRAKAPLAGKITEKGVVYAQN